MYTSFKDPYELSIKTLRKQINDFSPELRESARLHYMQTIETKLLNQQVFQCQMIGKLEKSLRPDAESGTFIAAGGHETSIYESFFRICPGKYMTKSQFIYGLTRVFGSGSGNTNVTLADSNISKLYDTFDSSVLNQMDWRCFLCLLVITMQPLASCIEHLRYMYAFYASYGELDFECPSKITLGTIKDFMSFPVLVSLRSKMRGVVHLAYEEIKTPTQSSQISPKAGILKANPDDELISFKMFEKMLQSNILKLYFTKFRPFGKCDSSAWVFYYEDEFYCPSLLKTLKIRRREARNDVQVVLFRKALKKRWKRIAYNLWCDYLRRRFNCRVILLWCTARVRYQAQGIVFDRWRKLAIADHCARLIQRVIRGFIGRSRLFITREVIKRSVVLQAVTRRSQQRQKYKQIHNRRYWAAITVQRYYRGFRGRVRVANIVMVLFDAGVRKLEKEKQAFYALRRTNAAICIQAFTKWCLRRKKAVERMLAQERMDALIESMEQTVVEARLKKIAFQQSLEDWFAKRKEEHDNGRMFEHMTSAERKKITQYRRRKNDAIKEEQRQLRQIREAEAEEKRIELWLLRWDQEVKDRKEKKLAQLKRAEKSPTTPEEIELKKVILKMSKSRIKVVLRRADKQRVPMEVPEATMIAVKEIIEDLVEAEGEKVREEMKEAAIAYEKEKVRLEFEDKAKEMLLRARRKNWAQETIIAYSRAYLARKLLRQKAYSRYKKYFDRETVNYYYADIRTGETLWDKPKSLGAYDIDIQDGWVSMKDSQGDAYYYNPHSMKMSRFQPYATALCDICKDTFAIARLLTNTTNYCENCFNIKIEELLELGKKPNTIIFQSFDGSLEGCTANNYLDFQEHSWKSYIGGLNTAAAEENNKEDEEEEDVLFCSMCPPDNTSPKPTQKKCLQCDQEFCDSCYEQRHFKAPWNLHTFHDIQR